MNPGDPNIQQLEIIIRALGGLRQEVVLVGGCAVGLLITDDARPPVRATKDVDLVLEVATKGDYYAFADKLRARKFAEDTSDGVICRWRYDGLIVDVMPTQEDILGFTNRWYVDIEKTSMIMALPSGNELAVASPAVFIATKIEAFRARGKEDFGGSHDIEDIINLVDGRAELLEEIQNAPQELHQFLREEFDDLLSATPLADFVAYHLAGDEINQKRASIIIQRMRAIAGL